MPPTTCPPRPAPPSSSSPRCNSPWPCCCAASAVRRHLRARRSERHNEKADIGKHESLASAKKKLGIGKQESLTPANKKPARAPRSRRLFRFSPLRMDRCLRPLLSHCYYRSL